MITIRAADNREVLAQGPAARTITTRAAQVPVDRVRVHVSPDGPALLAVVWEDGSRGLCEWAKTRECLDWLRLQPWARGRTVVHFPRGSRP